jgi:hypothetical protein
MAKALVMAKTMRELAGLDSGTIKGKLFLVKAENKQPKIYTYCK